MKNKLKFLIGVSLKRKIKTKWFLAANIILALAIIAVANIDHIITFFGGEFDEKNKIYVIDNTDVAYDLFTTYLKQSITEEEYLNYEIIETDKTKEENIELLKTEEEINSLVLIFNNSEENVIDVELISNDYVAALDLTVLNTTINNVKIYMAIEKYNISQEQLSAITSNVVINRTVLDENKDSTDENMSVIMTSVFPIFVLPFFMLVIFLVQMIGAEVNDEKTTRGMEIIISNVSPTVHFFSKCIAGNIFILMQSALLIAYVILGFISRAMFGDVTIGSTISEFSILLGGLFTANFIASLKYIIPLMLLLMILTFIGYSLLAGILASVTTNTEDFQQMQTPIMFISLLGYYLAIMAGAFEGSMFIKVLGYIPFISAILSPSLLVMGDFGIIDMIISMGLMIIVIIVLIKYGLKIYKVGILNYSSGNLWKKMFNALKNN